MRARLICLICFGTLFSLSIGTFHPVAMVHAATKKQAAIKQKVQKVYRKPKRVSVSAIPGKDEKNFSNPTSRCLTKAMKTLHQKALNQMAHDVEKFGAEYPAAAERYKTKLATVWNAMQEPYCGYGSRGVAAVKKSFLKSIGRIRAEFLADVKRGQKSSDAQRPARPAGGPTPDAHP